MLTTRVYTAEDLRAMPGDEPWELWDGELRKVPGSGMEASEIALIVASLIRPFARGAGVVTGADGSYTLSREPDTIVVPDAAFVRWARLPDRERTKRYCPVPPDIAVEVQSPTDEPKEMAEKRRLYARAGVPLLWWVDPSRRTVTVYRPGSEPELLTDADALDGGDVLPGLSIAVAEIFAE